MYLDHRAISRITHVLDQIDIQALLMDDQGSVIIPEGDKRRLTLPEAVRENPSQPLVYGGVTLIGAKSERGSKDDQQLFLCLSGDNSEARNCAVLTSEIIGMILKVDMDTSDRNQALRLILRGEIDVSEIETLAAGHSISISQERCVMYIHAKDASAAQIISALSGAINEESDMFTDVGRHTVALIKALPENADYSDLESCASAIDTALQDNDIDAMIGVSDPRSELIDLSSAFNEAHEAVKVGAIYRSMSRVFIYCRLLLERFLDTVPQNSGAAYGSMIFNSKTARLFGEEMIHTIEVFFENNLNLSEAARKLFIHRNTLVYRLEKVQKLTGFDLREFDDAVTFKLMMLLSKNANANNVRI